jgi:hypothetical protein
MKANELKGNSYLGSRLIEGGLRTLGEVDAFDLVGPLIVPIDI